MTSSSTRIAYRRWLVAAIMVGVTSLYACGGSDGNDPEPSPPEQPDPSPNPAPNPSDETSCFNPNLFQPGNSWTVTSVNEDGELEEVTITMKGPVTFNGYQVLDQQSGATHSYYAYVDGFMETYGAVDEDGIEMIFDPMHRFPVDMEIGKEYTSTATLVGSDGTEEQQTLRETLEDIETVEVPAGSFEACKVLAISETSGEAFPGISVRGKTVTRTWSIASGSRKGILLKTDVSFYIPEVDDEPITTTSSEATKIETNF